MGAVGKGQTDASRIPNTDAGPSQGAGQDDDGSQRVTW